MFVWFLLFYSFVVGRTLRKHGSHGSVSTQSIRFESRPVHSTGDFGDQCKHVLSKDLVTDELELPSSPNLNK